jgi:hypothetical protein
MGLPNLRCRTGFVRKAYAYPNGTVSESDLVQLAAYVTMARDEGAETVETVGTAIQKATDSCPKATADNPNGCQSPITWRRIGGNDGMHLLPKK